MDAQAYCSGLEAELTGWKGKLSDVAGKFDRRDTGDKDRIAHEIRDLHMVVEELSDRIERLHNSCSTQWEPDKIELETKITGFNPEWQDVWDRVSPSDFGG